ncbi:MAG TPA: LysM domain-containing protein [Burkholderiales bacterium]
MPGDTLWGISQRYTDSPWRWPELWGLNRDQIRNPHLIYPGDVILLDRASGRLTLGGPGAPRAGGPGAVAGTPGTTKLEPRVRSEPLDKEGIPSIPAALIEPFLTRPLIVEPDGLDNAPTIVGTEADRVILAAGNRAYVRGIGGGAKDGTWYVYRRGAPLVDPDTNQTLAYEAIYLGTAQVTRPGDPATVLLTTAVQEVEAGDKLIAAARPQPINYAPHAPSAQIHGRIMSIYAGSKVGEAGPQSIITINRGSRDGLEVGHVVALYNRGGSVRDQSKPVGAKDARIQLPDERAGLAFVFRVFDRVSYALVMRVTRPVAPLDVVQTP